MVNRQNKTTRPDQPIMEFDATIDSAFQKYGCRDKAFRLWVEEADAQADDEAVWPEFQIPNVQGSNAPILIFLKYFDAVAQTLKGVGHVYLRKQDKVADLVSLINTKMGWTPNANAPDTDMEIEKEKENESPTISLFEEIKHSMIEPMKLKITLQQAELQDGDIVCFEKSLNDEESKAVESAGGSTDAREFYDHLLNRKIISFTPKGATDGEKTFQLELSKRMLYEQFSAKVGDYLKVDPTHLRFSTVNATTGKPKTIVRRTGQNLGQTMISQFGQYSNSNQRDDALFYEVLEMSLSELDTKRTVKISWVTEGVSKEVCSNQTSYKWC